MDGLAKCIREIDSFLMAYLTAYDLTFESSFPYSYSNGSVFFDETVLKLRELTAHRERGGDQPT